RHHHPGVRAAHLGDAGGVVGAAALTGVLLGTGVIGRTSATFTTGSSQSITINPSDNDTSTARAVAAKSLPSVVTVSCTYDSGEGLGSGVVLDTEGNIITNNHVIEDADTITVTINGKSYDAELVGTDSSSDLAVVKADLQGDSVTPIEVGDSSALQVGDWVMSVGSPFGLEQSVSQGIVSALTRNELMQSSSGNTLYTNLIQVDAAINPGNSGGALVNDRGQLVGICTLYSSDTESFAGIGFAIPGNYAVDVAQKIVNGEQVTHAYIGLSMQTVNAQNAKANKLSVSQGAYVAEVTDSSPADEAGIQKGDIIVGIGGTQITSADGAILAVRSHSIGETVRVTVMRGNDEKTFDVTLGSDEELQRQQEEASNQPVSDINSYVNGNGSGNGSGQDNSQLLQQFQQWLQQQQESYGYGQRQR
ncbi:MAG: trypsin-like peptidase domain-containing protein, partial [Olsenella sp.]|nr:trypsin-like peptidase domain-containing protein [Olsenella sp.]